MTKRLIIVESPTKAKTLGKFLGPDYIVQSSVGHIRDLPASAADIPDNVKGEKWARLGIDIENDFAPLYIVHSDKKKVIRELKALLKGVDELYLATDEDREGEAISWHLLEELKPKIPVKRMVFHEITKEAIQHAVEAPRDVDRDLVEAQEARRIIDRLVGYEVSPILWKKIRTGLSAGRVQSVAIRMIVEREEARMRFIPAEYWDLVARFRTESGEDFEARLHSLGDETLASGRDFDPETGRLKDGGSSSRKLLSAKGARELLDRLVGSPHSVLSTEEKPFTQKPPAPFTTSTLQQEAGRKLSFDAKRTMRAAQRLYELGHITYMRTDSVHLSKEALAATRSSIEVLYGKDFLPSEARIYKGKVKNAQEAHEAIRPASEKKHFSTPSEIEEILSADESRLYELVWKRTLASQMPDARGRKMTVRIEETGLPSGTNPPRAIFQATGKVVDYPGFLRAYVEGSDDPEAELADRDRLLPEVKEGQSLAIEEPQTEQHFTKAPARFSEAALVKVLEEHGVGRPSTYASIIDTIQRRDYTFKKAQALVPTFAAFAVVRLLREHFSELVETEFTARLEEDLDGISNGKIDKVSYLKEFWFGNGTGGLEKMVHQNLEIIDARETCSIALINQGDQVLRNREDVIVRVGRYGPYLEAGEETANLPVDVCPDELDSERVNELFENSARGDEPLGTDPDSGKPVYQKSGRFGPYVQLGDHDDEEKPKMASLLKEMSADNVDLEVALKLLSFPKVVGQDETGVDIVVSNGRYGPYIKRGDDTRSLQESDHLFTVTKERCLELLAQPKTRGRRAPKEPLAVFEEVKALENVTLKVLDGRFGPYVTDGEYNATVPKSMDPRKLTVSEAVQLILDRRAKGPAKKKKKKKAASKKTAKRKTVKKKGTARKTAKKTTRKRVSTKKVAEKGTE
ncbi:MAG TPA: type I DNA topoisomerase [Planctomycetes bacterium]|nr:type I DNA topoisomerase [Planctomycetota bacterium]